MSRTATAAKGAYPYFGHRTVAELDAPAAPKKADLFVGTPVRDIAREMGAKLPVVKDRLNKLGYGVHQGIIYRKQSAQEVQDEIAARLASCPPAAPCHRCGAARGCEHRVAAWGVAA